MPRYVEAHDLELFATNTQEFYETHKQLVIRPLDEWVAHVIGPVMSRYCREVEPVQIRTEVATAVATALMEYYKRHQQEWAATVMAQVRHERRERGANVVPLSPAKLLDAQRIVQDAIGPQLAVLMGNPVDGFAVIGPFADPGAATSFLDSTDAEGWVVPLRQPVH